MNSRIHTPFYIFFLNPDYVAARSLGKRLTFIVTKHRQPNARKGKKKVENRKKYQNQQTRSVLLRKNRKPDQEKKLTKTVKPSGTQHTLKSILNCFFSFKTNLYYVNTS